MNIRQASASVSSMSRKQVLSPQLSVVNEENFLFSIAPDPARILPMANASS
jgi:hypothetical protein